MVLEVEQCHLGVTEGQTVTGPVTLDQLMLRDPVAFATETHGIRLQSLQAVLPHVEGLTLLGRQAVGVAES